MEKDAFLLSKHIATSDLPAEKNTAAKQQKTNKCSPRKFEFTKNKIQHKLSVKSVTLTDYKKTMLMGLIVMMLK